MGRKATPSSVSIEGDRIIFISPYDSNLVSMMRKIYGRHWDAENKANTFPLESATQVLSLAEDFCPSAVIDPQLKELVLKSDTPVRKLVRIERVEGGVEIITPYSVDFVEALKEALHPSLRAWRKPRKAWFIDHYAVDRAIKIVQNMWTQDVIEYVGDLDEYKKKMDRAAELATATKVSKEEEIVMEAGKLYGFQSAGVHFLEIKGSGIIADQMGLGKTIQALAFIARDVDRFPVLICCPSAVKMNWAREIMRWIGAESVSVDVIDGQYSYEIRSDGKKGRCVGRFSSLKENQFADIVITNYDVLQSHQQKFKEMQFATVIFDESHFLKNSKSNINNVFNEDGTPKINPKTQKKLRYNGSKRSMAGAYVARSIKHRILLTGTPIMNRPNELWHQLHIVSPESWPNFYKFAKRYCDLKRGKFGWDDSGSSNLDELNRLIIGEFVVRRRKMEVLKDMPEKAIYRRTLDIEPSERKEYDAAFKDFKKWAFDSGGEDKLRRAMRAEALSRMTALKRLAAEAKLEAAVEHIVDWLNSREDDQLVVFAHHKSIIQGLISGITKAGYRVSSIVGGDNITKRQQAIDDFKNGLSRVFVGSMLSSGTGVDGLQVAHNMMFLERSWVPAHHAQTEDRIHRIGQNEMCFIEYLDMEDSVDDVMASVLEDKIKVAQMAIDGKIIEENYVDNVMRELLKPL